MAQLMFTDSPMGRLPTEILLKIYEVVMHSDVPLRWDPLPLCLKEDHSECHHPKEGVREGGRGFGDFLTICRQIFIEAQEEFMKNHVFTVRVGLFLVQGQFAKFDDLLAIPKSQLQRMGNIHLCVQENLGRDRACGYIKRGMERLADALASPQDRKLKCLRINLRNCSILLEENRDYSPYILTAIRGRPGVFFKKCENVQTVLEPLFSVHGIEKVELRAYEGEAKVNVATSEYCTRLVASMKAEE